MKRTVFFALAICAAVLLSGCGYTSQALLPPELDSIHVNNFVNRMDPTREITDRRSNYSYRPGMENDITRAVIDEFIFDRHLDVVSESEAKMLLKGELIDIRLQPLSYSRDYDVQEFRMEVYVNMELYDNQTGKLMWKEDSFMGRYSYSVTGPNRMTDAQAQKEAVKDLAERIVERTVEAW